MKGGWGVMVIGCVGFDDDYDDVAVIVIIFVVCSSRGCDNSPDGNGRLWV